MVEAPQGGILLVVRWYKRRRDGGSALFVQLQLSGEAHVDNERLRVVDFDVVVEWWLEACCEGLDLLCLCECPRGGVKPQPVLVVIDGVGALASHEQAKRVGAYRWAEAEVRELGEAAPGWIAFILLDLDEPHLSVGLRSVGGHPNLLFCCNCTTDRSRTHN